MTHPEKPEGGLTAPFVAPDWDLGRVVLSPDGRPLVMGILNLTPDSFYPGSRTGDPEAAVGRALEMIAAGCDLLDLGAESTRPGAEPITAAEEQDRLLPVLEAVRRETALPLTVDTVRAETAAAALDAGADAVNDISAASLDPEMLPVVAAAGCGLVLMHMQGTPRTMQNDPRYRDVLAEVRGWLAARCRLAEEAGVAPARIMVDPGIGFGKNLVHNLALLKGLADVSGDRPLLLGASRKRFIAAVTGAGVDDRLGGSLAALAAAWQGGASMVRVHDVAATVQYLEVMKSIAGS
ncbi:MAG: dihydropteroate synthase [Candidatus Krumholzibacteriota bacterium]